MIRNGIHPAQPNIQASLFSINYIINTTKQHLLLFIFTTVVMISWICAYTYFVYEPSFKSKALVVIKESALTKRYVESDQYYPIQNTSSSSSNPVLNTEELLHSRTLSESLYNFFCINYPKELSNLHIHNLKEWIEFYGDGASFVKAKNKVGTDYISIDFTWKNPVIAQKGLINILEAFKNASLDINKAEERERALYLKQQETDLENRLQTIRDQKSNLQSNSMTLNVDQQNINLDNDRLNLEQQLSDLYAKLQGKIGETNRYKDLLGVNSKEAILASSIGSNTQLQKLNQELYQLNQQYADLSQHYTDASPNIMNLKNEIAQVQKNIDDELKRSLGKRYTPNLRTSQAIGDGNRTSWISNMVTSETEAVSLKRQILSLQNRLKQLDQQIKAAPVLQNKISNINEQEVSLSKALLNLRERILEANIKEAQTLSNVFIVDPPELPAKSEFPGPIHILLIGLIASIIMGVCTVLLKARFLSKSYKSTIKEVNSYAPIQPITVS